MKTLDSSFDNDNVAGDGMVTWQHAIDYASGLTLMNIWATTTGGFPRLKSFPRLLTQAGLSRQ